jgi:hypothetical protein
MSAMPEFLTTADGRWTPAAVRQRKPLVADASWLNIPGRNWVLSNGNTVLATIRRKGSAARQAWLVRVEGHEYLVTPDSQAAKNRWPIGTYIPVKAFPTSAEAKREVLRVLRTMPDAEAR